MKTENVFEVLLDPNRLSIVDETIFKLYRTTYRVLVQTGSKDVYEIDQAASKFSINVMFEFSVSGNTVEPMIICPFERIPVTVLHSVSRSWGISWSSNDQMTEQSFYVWIRIVLSRFLDKIHVQLPVMIFEEEHKLYLTRETCE